MARVPTITTERLVLRDWDDRDLGPFAALCADPTVMEHFPSTLSSAEATEFVDRARRCWQVHGYGLWAVELRTGDPTADGQFVGYVGLAPGDAAGAGLVEVGWRLAATHWGNGYAPEAATHALAWAFLSLGLDEVVSFTTVGNVRSQRVMAKIGMVRDPARDFDHPHVDRTTHPALVRHVVWSTTRSDWLDLHDAHP